MLPGAIGLDPVTIALALGGALGPLLRAAISTGESWRSKQTRVDIVLGAAFGILLPVLPLDKLAAVFGITSPLPTLPSGWTPLQYGAGMTVVTYMLGDLLRERILNRWAKTAPPQDRRAADPPAPAP